MDLLRRTIGPLTKSIFTRAPARTSTAFEHLQSGAQGAGLACNTRVSGH